MARPTVPPSINLLFRKKMSMAKAASHAPKVIQRRALIRAGLYFLESKGVIDLGIAPSCENILNHRTGHIKIRKLLKGKSREMGLEPTTSGVTSRCSNQLNYSRVGVVLSEPYCLGRNRTRTYDHLCVRQELYQLSYTPLPFFGSLFFSVSAIMLAMMTLFPQQMNHFQENLF